MKGIATALGKDGVHDWLWQRISAVLIAGYLLFVFAYIVIHPQVSFNDWVNLFSHRTMKIFSGLFLLSLLIHAWVGLWTITTDYLKPISLKLICQLAVILTNLVLFLWGIEILWNV